MTKYDSQKMNILNSFDFKTDLGEKQGTYEQTICYESFYQNEYENKL